MQFSENTFVYNWMYSTAALGDIITDFFCYNFLAHSGGSLQFLDIQNLCGIYLDIIASSLWISMQAQDH